MTAMQASVISLEEIERAFAAGADLCLIEDWRIVEPGLLGPLAKRFGPDRLGLMLSPGEGDAPDMLARACQAVQSGIGRLFVPWKENRWCAGLASHVPDARIFAVFLSEHGWRPDDLAGLVAENFAGAMLDSAEPNRAHLLKHDGIVALHEFVQACQAAGLSAGFAGALETPDIARLLVLEPSFLSFRGALRREHRRQGVLDPEALALVRALIPRKNFPREPSISGEDEMIAETGKVDWRLAGRKMSEDEDVQGGETDHVFVHDLILPMSVGAYAVEQKAAQRVRINVDLAVQRITHHADTIRDVFSYDLIIDAVRLLLARGHVSVIETLAEELAAALLQHQRVFRARVRVEKLDVIEMASVGIEIIRKRPVGTRASRPLLTLSETAMSETTSGKGGG
ncbi:dihydroneopterin aldolase [Beijerinckia indica]|uniref:4-(hydroxymethyl)-2-furancarboxaldehyde-phosphate synthase n=1 Tax=Beijerinckia indica subsp. indica (strain ATCC 9039 / DSM 1715 / NCIMB 8712) TaxID=395963 RepID=B2IG59_BEII9|nr:dihydroneopterin aldolase [Beijerinckia indica]ACB97133.1 dihydroneopterin aldolase [Beijerinckia indica subsp. indica ATCC 9039]